ncbi:DUF7144 family membrane protein [Saccharopolyspora sp. 5N708]|uniref:DUF7144 family membrane protein n=1 Tax=Saccharopolyspora sp. 5N708 TaxID=3457424 RepID=UPI003FD58D9A
MVHDPRPAEILAPSTTREGVMTSHEVPHGQLRTRWLGLVIFAGIMMIAIGVTQIVFGIAALARSGMYMTPTGTVVAFDFRSVGWSYLLLGILVAAAGFGVMSGRTWARVVGILLAGLSVLANLAFFTAYPVWSALVIVLDVVVIYALAAHGREARPIPR